MCLIMEVLYWCCQFVCRYLVVFQLVVVSLAFGKMFPVLALSLRKFWKEVQLLLGLMKTWREI